MRKERGSKRKGKSICIWSTETVPPSAAEQIKVILSLLHQHSLEIRVGETDGSGILQHHTLLPPLLHFPSSTFTSSCNLCGNLPASAPLSSKLLPGSSQIRDRSISEPIFPAGSGAGCARPRQAASRLNQRSSSSFFSHCTGPGPFPRPRAELTSSAVSFSMRTILFSQ